MSADVPILFFFAAMSEASLIIELCRLMSNKPPSGCSSLKPAGFLQHSGLLDRVAPRAQEAEDQEVEFVECLVARCAVWLVWWFVL